MDRARPPLAADPRRTRAGTRNTDGRRLTRIALRAGPARCAATAFCRNEPGARRHAKAERAQRNLARPLRHTAARPALPHLQCITRRPAHPTIRAHEAWLGRTPRTYPRSEERR